MFGFERRGAPVTAFMRFDENPIREKTKVYNPDCLVVLDSSQKNSPIIYDGLKPNGVLVLNSTKPISEKPHNNVSLVGKVDAERIALEELGIPSPNTCMVGAFAAATKWIGLEHICSSLEQFFSGDLLERNIRCAERGFQEVRVIRW
jgi:2-oxoacid:acceptor oxidoreductase gamma subunit (pyruvate/2-ketoisovalerate family)